MIKEREIDQVFSELRSICRGVKQDYFGLLYLEHTYGISRDKAVNQVAFGGNDYGIDGFHFDELRHNLYLFQFKYSNAYGQFKGSLQRLIDDGMDLIFDAPNHDDKQSQVLIQLRSCLQENRALIDQICIKFVFLGDPADARKSQSIDALREKLEDKKYLVDRFFAGRDVPLVVEFLSDSGRVGSVSVPRHTSVFKIPMEDLVTLDGPEGQELHVGLIRLCDLLKMQDELKYRFFDRNIRYDLGEAEAVNRAIAKSLRQIVIEKNEDPRVFAFNHNGITLFAEQLEWEDGICSITAPRILNGAQTVGTASRFISDNKDNPRLKEGKEIFERICVICRVLTKASNFFVTQVTINNNRQNPVEPWNLHANDLIQLELLDKFIEDTGIYYERQENAFAQFSADDLEDYGIKAESKKILMLKLTQTFILTDGNISRLSEIRKVFEEDRLYEQVFRRTRLTADTRHIILCYKIQFLLRKLSNDILNLGQNKYSFIHRSRNLLLALLCQGLLNDDDLEDLAEQYGTNMVVPVAYKEYLSRLATNRVRQLLARLLEEAEYKQRAQEGNFSFLRSDAAFERCMEFAHEKWRWVHRKLSGASVKPGGKVRA